MFHTMLNVVNLKPSCLCRFSQIGKTAFASRGNASQEPEKSNHGSWSQEDVSRSIQVLSETTACGRSGEHVGITALHPKVLETMETPPAVMNVVRRRSWICGTETLVGLLWPSHRGKISTGLPLKRIDIDIPHCVRIVTGDPARHDNLREGA